MGEKDIQELLEKQDDTGNSSNNGTDKRSAIEETLQSIDSTLKRIEKMLSSKTDVDLVIDGIATSVTKAFSSSRLVKNEEDKKASPRHRW